MDARCAHDVGGRRNGLGPLGLTVGHALRVLRIARCPPHTDYGAFGEVAVFETVRNSLLVELPHF